LLNNIASVLQITANSEVKVAIDVEREKLITLSQAANQVPWGKVDPSTPWRWARGRRGVKLETVLCGGRRYTSREALLRFFAATSKTVSQASASPATVPMTAAPRRRASEASTETMALHKAIGLGRLA
jgi:hypothetical protein